MQDLHKLPHDLVFIILDYYYELELSSKVYNLNDEIIYDLHRCAKDAVCITNKDDLCTRKHFYFRFCLYHPLQLLTLLHSMPVHDDDSCFLSMQRYECPKCHNLYCFFNQRINILNK
jgi:hypothetical protein